MQTTFTMYLRTGNIFISCFLCLSLLLLNGCGGVPSADSVPSVDSASSTVDDLSAIVGKWEVDAEDKSVAQSRMEFLDDGILIVDDDRTQTETWRLENNKLILTLPESPGSPGIIQLDYEISGSTLTLTGGQHGHTVRYNRQ